MKVVKINKNKPAEQWTQHEILNDPTTDWMIPLYECQDSPQVKAEFRLAEAKAKQKIAREAAARGRKRLSILK